MTTARIPWIVQIDTANDLCDGGNDTYLALSALTQGDEYCHVLTDLPIVAEGAESAVIDGVTVTADEADDMLDAWVGAVTAAWIARANEMGYVGQRYDGAESSEADRENERIGQARGMSDIWEAVNGATVDVWDHLLDGDWPTLASVAA